MVYTTQVAPGTGARKNPELPHAWGKDRQMTSQIKTADDLLTLTDAVYSWSVWTPANKPMSGRIYINLKTKFGGPATARGSVTRKVYIEDDALVIKHGRGSDGDTRDALCLLRDAAAAAGIKVIEIK